MDFPDVRFNLADNTYQPYNKPNNIPTSYIKQSSKVCSQGNWWRSEQVSYNSLSSSEVMFNNNKEMYQNALILPALCGNEEKAIFKGEFAKQHALGTA